MVGEQIHDPEKECMKKTLKKERTKKKLLQVSLLRSTTKDCACPPGTCPSQVSCDAQIVFHFVQKKTLLTKTSILKNPFLGQH